MKENKNSDLSFQVTFVKCLLGLIAYNVLAWILSFFLAESAAWTVSFLASWIAVYFYLPAIKKLGFLKWAGILLLFIGCGAGVRYGNTLFGGSRLWGGIVFAFLGVMSFFFNWLYLWVMSNGEKNKGQADLVKPRMWLLWNGLGGLAMIIFGICLALGFFD